MKRQRKGKGIRKEYEREKLVPEEIDNCSDDHVKSSPFIFSLEGKLILK